MALLTLKDIGKIYVSEGNVTVGIRGVNLSFDRGEFVAITGKSGSGKSTLLNVISGMDSYEEGELLIEGQTTSHYLQPEWEEYRAKYISFIFQDYNIIESFTVLQNVELALMHIEDKKERRLRALELIDRVGLRSHVKQKGSKLSGGQKQRTVIARALAKDSPIILADEPTGNLDSTTSREIIELLREVSHDKLLIVVTHNFEQVEMCATRHIRVFDGAIESDHVLRHAEAVADQAETQAPPTFVQKKHADVKNGVTLGRTIFSAKPKLSVFLCLLMIIGTLGVFLVTALCGQATDMFDPHYMFTPIDGRVVLTKQNGEVITEEELQALVKEYGAEGYLPYDVLLDTYASVYIPDSNDYMLNYLNMRCTYGEDFGEDIIGRYPSAPDEIFLYLPISYQTIFGESSLEIDRVELFNSVPIKVCGVKYYYDNNQIPRGLLTEEGFRTVTAIHFLTDSDRNITLTVRDEKQVVLYQNNYYSFSTSYGVEDGKIYLPLSEYQEKEGADMSATLEFRSTYYKYDYFYYDYSKVYNFSRSFTDADLTDTLPSDGAMTWGDPIFSATLVREIAEEVLRESYMQASLFFADDKAAHAAAQKLNDAGFMAVPSDTTYSPPAEEVIMALLECIMMAFVWLLAILFLAFFINLCSSRTLSAFKGDMAIMRSMGIPVKVIRIGMYVRMLISLIPAFILVVLTALLIFTSPKFNQYFVYLYAWQYAVIFLGMLLLTVRITYKQIRKLFRESVKKSLKGGAAE